jgi:hypothetical protein
VAVEQVVGDIEAVIARRTRLMQQFHPCFLWCASALAPVAGDTGTDYVVPVMLPTPPARDNMVQGKFLGLPATVLAGILVTTKYL